MSMFNPLTRSRVSLPSFGTFHKRWDNEDEVRHNYFVTRAVVLNVQSDADADDDDVENLRVVAFYSDDNVAIVKPGKRRWVEIEGGRPRPHSPLRDVTYDSDIGLIFVDSFGGVQSCDVPEEEESPFLEWIRPPVEQWIEDVVKCGDDLLLASRVVEYGPYTVDEPRFQTKIDGYKTTVFEVYKFNFKGNRWSAVHDMKNVALFVGNNATMWVDARSAGCQSDYVYFTDDIRIDYRKTNDRLGGLDFGKFTSSTRSRYDGKCIWPVYQGSNMRSSYCCPLWFQPSISRRTSTHQG